MLRLAPALIVGSLVALSAACSKKDDPPRPGPGTVAATIDAAAPPPVDAAPVTPAADAAVAVTPAVKPVFHFDDLSKEDQVEYMKKKVTPAMKQAFRDFDGKAFKTFNCKTCHGRGAITKEYDMPSRDLPKLDFAKLRAGENAEMVKFMKEVVTPQMAELLGEPVETDTTEGFGCLDCHEQK